MKMINTDNCEAFTTELLKILRCKHPDYSGDPLKNCDSVLTKLAVEDPKKALNFALEIQNLDPEPLGMRYTLNLWAHTLIDEAQNNMK